MKQPIQVRRFLLCIFLFTLGFQTVRARVVYVDSARVAGAQNGTSWANAYANLQSALSIAASGDSLWVAKGTYYPGNSGVRSASFYAVTNVRLYGGFTGFSGSQESSLSQRNWNLNRAILSGDLDQSNTLNNNDAYHVIQSLGGMDTTATFDGFRITGGNANGVTATTDWGGGIAFVNSSIRLANCDIRGNYAASFGGAIYGNGSLVATNCFFRFNNSGFQGGAGYFSGSSKHRFYNCVFSNNTSVQIGGAVINGVNDSRFFNCTFSTNNGTGGRSVFSLQSGTVFQNCIFWGHTNPAQALQGTVPIVRKCIIEGGYSGGTAIIDADPGFRDADFRIKSCSPAADAGDSLAFLNTDLDGAPRPFDANQDLIGKWDIGAFEAQVPAIVPVANAIAGPSPSCANQQNVLYQPATNNSPANTYTWSISGGGAIDGSSTGPSVLIDWGSTLGTYTITMVEAGAISGCANSNTLNVTLQASPSVTLAPNGAGAICAGDSILLTGNGTGISMQWYRNGISIPGATASTLYAKTSGAYNMLLSGSNGCADSAASRFVLTVNPLPVFTIGASGSTSICQGQSVTLSGPTPGNAYQWYRNGNPLGGAIQSTYLATLAGTYNLFYTNTNGCKDFASSTVSVVVNPLPITSITTSGSDTICPSSSKLLTASTSNPNTWQWYRNGAIIPSANANTYPATLTGVYNCRATNSNGCTDSSATGKFIRVGDFVPPVAQCQNRSIYLDAGGVASIPASSVDNNSSDNCAISTTALSTTNFGCAQLGANAVSLTVTDVGGNSAQCNATITVLDTIKTIANCGNPTIYLGPSGSVVVNYLQVNAGSTDNCSIAGGSVSPNSFNCAQLGPRTVTMTVQDASGNARSCTATVTIADSTRPIAVCNHPAVVLNGGGNASILLAQVEGGSSDNCAIASQSLSRTSFTCNDVPGVFITMSVNDVNGNTGTCQSYVRVQDIVAPVAVCRDTAIYINFSGQSVLSPANINGGSSDNCAITQLSISKTLFACQDVGVNSVVLTVQDADTNVHTCISQVSVFDTIPPVASCTNSTFYLGSNGTVTVNPLVVGANSLDNCLSFDTAYVDVGPFTCAGIGPHPVLLVVVDFAGARDSCNGIITVADSSGPVAVCQDITVQLVGGNASIGVAQINNGTTDNCQLASMSLSKTAFNCTDIGVQPVVLTALDSYGNDGQCTAQVLVMENTPPIAACQPRTIYLNNAGTANIAATSINNGSTDNCGSVSLALSQANFTCANTGSNSVTLTVSDGSGNTAQCNATVTVLDSVRPIAVCNAITAYLNAAGTFALNPSMIGGGSSDNCSISSYTLSKTNFICQDSGLQAVTLTATDPSGNTRQCLANVVLRDTVRPVPACVNATIYLNSLGVHTLSSSTIAPFASDNCGIASATLSQVNFGCSDVGLRQVIGTFRDVSGNSATCTVNLTVLDTVSPAVSCNNLTVYLGPSGTEIISLNDVDAGSADPCGIDTRVLSANSFGCQDLGFVPVLLTVTDANGNSASCTSMVTVLDTMKPTAVCSPQALFLDSTGQAIPNLSLLSAGSTDVCGIANVSVSHSQFSCNDVGITNVVVTVSDPSGNTRSCATTISVTDNIRPIAHCDSAVVQLQANGTGTILPSAVGGNSWDNCGNLTFALEVTNFDCSDKGFLGMRFWVNDPSNNRDSCYAVVYIVDTSGIADIPVNLGNDTVACNGASITLNAGSNLGTYLWSTGSSSSQIQVANVGTYWVSVENAIGCTGIDSIDVGAFVTPNPNLRTESGETVVCQNDNLVLMVDSVYAAYLWSTGSTGPTTNITTGGNYIVQLTDFNGCTITPSISIQSIPFPAPQAIITPPGPLIVCENTSIQLDAGPGYFGYLWSTGQTFQTISVGTLDTFSVQVWNGFGCHSISPPVFVSVATSPQPNIIRIVDTLTTNAIAASYQWLLAGNPVPGATQNRFVPASPGAYSVRVQYLNGCTNVSPTLDFVVGSVDPNSALASIMVFPNPTSGRLSVQSSERIKSAIKVSLIDMQGRLCLEEAWPNLVSVREMDLGDLPAGFYLLEMRTQQAVARISVIKL